MNSIDALNRYFGYTTFRSGQEAIIDSIIAGENVLAVLPTGGGKSICYQIPSLLSKTFAVVVSPLIALMKDQVDSLNKTEVIAAFVNSTLDYHSTEKVLRDIELKQLKILYVSPEKLASKGFSEKIKFLSPEYIFIDEAHCISEWGHNFRPSYRKIKDFIELCEVKKIGAFTATATEEVRNDIIKQLGLADPRIFIKGFERSNLSLSARRIINKKEKVLELLKPKSLPAIVYAATRKACEDLAEYLTNNNLNAVYYHAGIKPELKRLIQDDFMSGRIKIICATNAFGMGIDKSDIRTIIHFNMPGSIENYYQEIGRAGRDGNNSNVFLLFDEKDQQIQKYFIESSFPSRKQIETAYDIICDYAGIALGMKNLRPVIVDQGMLSLFEKKQMNQTIIDSTFRILSDSRYIELINETKNQHQVRFPLNPKKLLSFLKNYSNADHKDLLVLLAREYGALIFKDKVKINLTKLASEMEEPANEIVRFLQQLSQGGIIDYDSPSSLSRLSLVSERVPSVSLKLDLAKQKLLYKNLNHKLEQMIRYSETNDCRMKFILNYFGEESENYRCGKCDSCTGGEDIQSTTMEYLDELILQTLHESTTPIKKRNLLQILTGKADIPSLKSFSSFGTCAHFKKAELEHAFDALVSKKLLLTKNDSYALSEKGIENFTKEKDEPNEKIDYEDELHLFNLLRQARKEAAEKFGQSSSLICSDEILKLIAQIKPKTHSELLSIDGFTQRMFNKIGEELITIVRDSAKQNIMSNKTGKVSGISLQLGDLIERKYSIEEISKILKLPESLLIFQIESIIKLSPDLDISGLVSIKEQKMINQLINEEVTELKQISETLKNRISYSKIKLVLAKRGII